MCLKIIALMRKPSLGLQLLIIFICFKYDFFTWSVYHFISEQKLSPYSKVAISIDFVDLCYTYL